MTPTAPKAVGQVFYDTLPDIKVSGTKRSKSSDLRSELNIGQYADSFSEQTLERYRNLSLATLLSQQSPVFVRSYGINNLATLSFRGASAAQSMVLWKGVPLNDPALGISDVSLIQTGLFNKVSLQYGGNAAMLGSGNVGGALLLDERADLKKPAYYSIGAGGGSFGRRDAIANAAWNLKKWHFGIKGFYQAMRNDFRYRDLNGDLAITEHAALKAFGGIANAQYSINERQNISLDLWYQDHKREIPKARFEELSTKLQRDKALRSLLQWNNQSRHGHFYAKFSLNRNDLDFSDSFYNTFNKNSSYQYYQELGWKRSFVIKNTEAKHNIFINAPFQYSWIILQDGRRPLQSRPALAAAYQYLHGNKRLGAQLNLRQEWLNGIANPVLPGAGLQYLLAARQQWQFTVKGSLQRTYRIPTLNELYNFPGGNEDLRPEQGWNRELAYDLKWQNATGSVDLRHQLNYFNRKIQDWIYWLGGSIWTPHNLAKVHNRGLETNTQVNYTLNKNWQAHIGLKTAYVLSTTLESYMPNDGSIGKQIPYAPRYSGNINLGLTFKNLLVNYNHTYTGYRFITTDESLFLLPYNTGNLQLTYPLQFHKLSSHFSFQVQNLWNLQYEVVAHRPMPRRFLMASMAIEL